VIPIPAPFSRAASCRAVFFLFLFFAARASATEWHVLPDGTGDAPTIQAAITAAQPGDVVILEPGTFTGPGNRNVDFLGKAITVTSASGTETTIIDCQGIGRGFVFQNGETNSSVLEGVTVTNGEAPELDEDRFAGGALACLNASSPIIRECVLINNEAADWGGAIECVDGSSPWIVNNKIISNRAGQHSGGIMCMDRSSALIEGNLIKGNSAPALAGGVHFVNGSNGTMINNLVQANTAGRNGGGLYCFTADAYIEGNVFFDNTAGVQGGGVSIYRADPILRGNTVAENRAPAGAGVTCVYPAEPLFENCIIAFNKEGEGFFSDLAAPTVSCSNVYGNAGGDQLEYVIDGGGNYSADPLFCGIPNSGNFLLQEGSPCLPANNTCAEQIGALPLGCGTTPVTKTTWGSIKARYRE
jgi:hypothetical protein